MNLKNRQGAVDRFSNPDIDRFVFLLSTKAGKREYKTNKQT